MERREKANYALMLTLLGVLLGAGFWSDGPLKAIKAAWGLQWAPARLINDFTVVATVGGAYVNAALMGLLSLFIVRINGVRLAGPTIAATLTIVGFSLFGKTITNALPIMAGVWLAARFAAKPFKNYLLMALFGTAAGPIVSFIMGELGLPPALFVPLGMAAGLATGFLLPGLAMAMLRMHEGFNLYNIGLTVGFLSLFAASLARAGGQTLATAMAWNQGQDPFLVAVPAVFSLVLLGFGLARDPGALVKYTRKIYQSSGRLPSDFMDYGQGNAALVNAGIQGLVGWGYLLAVGAPINGPTMGALFTLMGFSTFGKHLRNSLPIMAGVVVATLLSGKSLAAPGPALAAIFSTTLAPLAGEFGVVVGILAGMVHLLVVEQSGAWHGGFNLYNNGFAGGLTATLFVAAIQWWRASRS